MLVLNFMVWAKNPDRKLPPLRLRGNFLPSGTALLATLAAGQLFRKTGKALDIFDLKIRKMVHNLYFEIREGLHNLPFAGTIRKGIDPLDMKIGKRIDDLYFIIGKTADELNSSVDFRELRPFR